MNRDAIAADDYVLCQDECIGPHYHRLASEGTAGIEARSITASTLTVWVAQLDIGREGFSGTWLTVHKTRERARLVIATRAKMHGVTDLYLRALRQDTSTSSEVASSTAVHDGPREITWVINRHTVD